MFTSFLQSSMLVSDQDRLGLKEEALLVWASAELHTRSGYQILHGDQFLGPRNQWGTSGKRLQGFHEREIADGLSELLRTPLRPTLSSYIYYRQGGFIALHRDQPICSVVMLVWLSGPAGSLHIHPELKDEKAQVLVEHAIAHGGHPPGGERINLQDGPFVMAGHRIPHHRPPHQDEDEVVMAGLCFALE